ncbi:hypothetical protein LTR08_001509 [Meristemomyces frigidus]|nr:hypothetical protein LTR08_001509 [Meristemomyces frigidus]
MVYYDQSRHACVFNEGDPVDMIIDERPLAWQPLESVLSVYMDMIERSKAVALHKSVQEPPPMWEDIHPDGSVTMRYFSNLPPREPQQDPASGARRIGTVYDPWVIVSYTSRDLSETLEHWNDLVQAIEERMSSLPQDALEVKGLYTPQTLLDAGIRTDSFAWEFFSRARKPKCTYLGPGLRLPTPTELTLSPTRDLQEHQDRRIYPNHIYPICVLPYRRARLCQDSRWL